MDSSSTSNSPFSPQSTDASSPDMTVGVNGSTDSYTQAIQAQSGVVKNGFGPLFAKGVRAGSPLKDTMQVKTEPGVASSSK